MTYYEIDKSLKLNIHNDTLNILKNVSRDELDYFSIINDKYGKDRIVFSNSGLTYKLRTDGGYDTLKNIGLHYWRSVVNGRPTGYPVEENRTIVIDSNTILHTYMGWINTPTSTSLRWGLKLMLIDNKSFTIINEKEMVNSHVNPYIYERENIFYILLYDPDNHLIECYVVEDKDFKRIWFVSMNDILPKNKINYRGLTSFKALSYRQWFVNADRSDKIVLTTTDESDITDKKFNYAYCTLDPEGINVITQKYNLDYKFDFLSPDMHYVYGSTLKTDGYNMNTATYAESTIIKYDLQNDTLIYQHDLKWEDDFSVYKNWMFLYYGTHWHMFRSRYLYNGDIYTLPDAIHDNPNSLHDTISYLFPLDEKYAESFYAQGQHSSPYLNPGPIDVHQHRFVEICGDLEGAGRELNASGTDNHLEGIAYRWRPHKLYNDDLLNADSVATEIRQWLSSTGSDTLQNPVLPESADKAWSGVYVCDVTDSVPGDSVFTWQRIVFVRMVESPSARLTSGSDIICEGDTLTVKLSGWNRKAESLLWHDGDTSRDSLLVTGPGTFSATLTGFYGCTATDSLTVMADTMELAVLPDLQICEGDTAEVSVDGRFSSVLWSTGDTARTAYLTETGNYWVEAVSPAGCTYREGFRMLVGGRTEVDISVIGDTVLCLGVEALLHPRRYHYSHSWQRLDGNGDTQDLGTSDTLLVTEAGRYVLLTESISGCEGSDTVNITAAPAVLASIGTEGELCAGGSVTLSALPFDDNVPDRYAYLWDDGSVNRERTVEAAGVYSVTVTESATGCDAAAETTVEAGGTAFTASIEGGGAICEGGETVLTAQPYDPADPERYAYLWDDGSTDRERNVTAGGIYTVAVEERGSSCEGSTAEAVVEEVTVSLTAEFVGPADVELEYGSAVGTLEFDLTNTSGIALQITVEGTDYDLAAGETMTVQMQAETDRLGERSVLLEAFGRSETGCETTSTAVAAYTVYGRVELTLARPDGTRQETFPGEEISLPVWGRSLSAGLEAVSDITAVLDANQPNFSPVPGTAGEPYPLVLERENATFTDGFAEVGTFEGITMLMLSGQYPTDFGSAELSGGESEWLRLTTTGGTIDYLEDCGTDMMAVAALPGYSVRLAAESIEITTDNPAEARVEVSIGDISGRSVHSGTAVRSGTGGYRYGTGGLAGGIYTATVTANGLLIWSGMLSVR
jgi:hypothetical protein